MEQILFEFLEGLPIIVLLLIFAGSLGSLAKGADILVEEAVSISVMMKIPKLVIGATIVSLGTTLPEATVSVMAALGGNPDLALGNAIGSIIADTGLIIGLASMINILPIDKFAIDRQGRIQYLAGLLLALVALPFMSISKGGHISQVMGVIFVLLLAVYMYMSFKWARQSHSIVDEEVIHIAKGSVLLQIIKLAIGVAVVIASSKVLIPTVEIVATRVGVPQSVIAATLVAFGTSLPELITAITAARKGHGELAIGNIMGADILNVLFVVGLAAAVTPGGLEVPSTFYKLQIPFMVLILFIFRFFAKNRGNVITKKEGIYLLLSYIIYLVLNFTIV